MTLPSTLTHFNTIFIDTAPIIYFIEAHPQFGPLIRDIIQNIQSQNKMAYTSVITLAEVLPRPVQAGNTKLVNLFAEFLQNGKNIQLIGISAGIAEKAGKLRGKNPNLRLIDALQIAVALEVGAEVFLTNDKKLKKIKDINVMILKDYLK